MRINDGIVHQRSLSARLDEKDLRRILIEAVAAEAGFPFDPRDTEVKFWISQERSGDRSTWVCEIHLTNDLPILDEDGETT